MQFSRALVAYSVILFISLFFVVILLIILHFHNIYKQCQEYLRFFYHDPNSIRGGINKDVGELERRRRGNKKKRTAVLTLEEKAGEAGKQEPR